MWKALCPTLGTREMSPAPLWLHFAALKTHLLSPPRTDGLRGRLAGGAFPLAALCCSQAGTAGQRPGRGRVTRCPRNGGAEFRAVSLSPPRGLEGGPDPELLALWVCWACPAGEGGVALGTARTWGVGSARDRGRGPALMFCLVFSGHLIKTHKRPGAPPGRCGASALRNSMNSKL